MKLKTLLLTLLLLSFNTHSACSGQDKTTIGISECYMEEYKVEGKQLEKTLTQSYNTSGEISNEIRLSQKAWMKYRDTHCKAIYASYGRGTMRSIAYPSCMVELTRQRQKELYKNFVKSLPMAD